MQMKAWMNFLANELCDCRTADDTARAINRLKARYKVTRSEVEQFLVNLHEACKDVRTKKQLE